MPNAFTTQILAQGYPRFHQHFFSGVKQSFVEVGESVKKLVQQVFTMLRQVRDSGVTVLLVEQNVKAALALADRAAVMVEGRERYGVRVRYPQELRDTPEWLASVLVPVNHDAGGAAASGGGAISGRNSGLTPTRRNTCSAMGVI